MIEYNLTVNGIELEGRPADSSSCYLLQQVEGLDSRDFEEDVQTRAGRDGDVTSAQTRRGIRIIVSGYIIASSAADLRSKESALRAAIAGGESFAVTLAGRTGDVADLTETFWVSAPFRSADTVDGPRLAKPFSFSVRSDADTWEKASSPTSSSSSVAPDISASCNNAGDLPVYPTCTLTNTSGSNTIDYIENVTTGEKLELDALPISSTQVLVVDFENRSILIGAADMGAYVNAAAVWFKLAKGTNSIRFHMASGTAISMVVSWKNRYL